ncbi:daptide-type RiPP biosynthesis aminotransferase [Actinoplanes sp. NBRC 103695]|uniref:daptide-type RiPP biosynthesis aminotransferase n=1 Tax=Actinoplanes sp. NBRC 103695 TaxID=3032202 RepID=UPI0024A42A2B|nr:daptide-type RiPP biosynthesis aminotransferase [Actinoplanes sp. NBRC 103695]GLZ01172.1 aspartate aminotransferase family protein [Actinoplanes sp. NBRC 103695]
MTPSDRYPLWESLTPPSRFGDPGRTAVRAEGTRILFEDGAWRLCATSGLWNVSLGYGNLRIAEAVAEALRDASYLSLFRGGHRLAVEASRQLLDLAGPEHFGRVAYATSGGSANDQAMKIARQFWSLRRQYRRRIIVGLRGSYHGLTYGSHGLSGMALAQSYYSVDQSLIRHVSHADPAELRALLEKEGDRIAAVVVEPVLGTGAHPLPPAMLEALHDLRDEYGFLLVADEVATGFGRTGPVFASTEWRSRPDLMLVSKALTNGTCAAAAILVSHQVCAAFEKHDAVLTHAETSAGLPATCAAILATLAEMRRLTVFARGRVVGDGLTRVIAGLADHPLVAGDGGVGCFRAVRLRLHGRELADADVVRVMDEIRTAGVVVSPGPSCIQISPALVYQKDDLDELAAGLRAGLDQAYERLLAVSVPA